MELAPASWLSILRVVVVGIALLLAPGWLLQSLTLRSTSLPPLSRVPISFALSVGSIALLGVISYLLHGSLTTMAYLFVAWLGLLLLLWLWQVARRPISSRQKFPLAPGTLGATVLVLVFALFCAGLAYYAGTWFSHIADDFYHLAIVRRIIEGGNIFPQDVLYAYEYSPSGFNPILSTWHVVLALLSLGTGMDIAWLWWRLPVLIAPLLVLSFYEFAFALLKKPWLALFCTVLHVILYGKLDFRASVWPNQAGFVLLWVAFIFLFAYLDSGSLRELIVIEALIVVMVSWHLLMVEFFLLSIGAYLSLHWLVVWYTKRQISPDTESRRLFFILLPALMVGVPFFIFRTASGGILLTKHLLTISSPTFRASLNLGSGLSVIDPRGLSVVGPRWRFAPQRFGMWLFCYLTSLALIPGCLKRQRFSVFAFSSTVLVPLIMFNPFLITFLQGKIIDIGIIRLVLLPPYGLVVGWFLWDQTARWLQRFRSLLGSEEGVRRDTWKSVGELALRGTLVAVIGCVLVLQGIDNLVDLYSPSSTNRYSLKTTHERMRRSDQPPFKFLIDHGVSRSVVVSDPIDGYYLSGMTGLPVVAAPPSHYPPAGGPSHEVRQQDSLEIMDASVELNKTIELMDKYDVCLVWVDTRMEYLTSMKPYLNPVSSKDARRKFESRPDLFDKVYEDPQVSIYQYLKHEVDCIQ